MQLIQTIHDISKSLDKKGTVDMAIFDFVEAFDKVPYKRLIDIKHYYRISGSIATWIETFFCYRKDPTGDRQWGIIIIYHRYLGCTPGNRSWAATFPFLHRRPSRQPTHKCTALCRLLYFIYTYQNTT